MGDTSDVSEVAKAITKANLEADLTPALADTVTTNANLTGHVTSSGNAAVLGSFTKAQLDTAVSDDTILYDSELTSIADVKALDQSVVSGAAPVLDATNFTNLPSGTPEGTAVLSTGEAGGTKYLREDGDGTCSWQAVAGAPEGTAVLSTGEAGGVKFLREDGDNTSSWQALTAASETVAGAVELTTDAEYTTGTDTTRATTAANAKVELDKKLALAGGTMTGDITLGEDTSIAIDPSISADASYTGITVAGTGGATIAVGDVIYLDVTAGEWLLADASAKATAGDVCIGIAASTSTDGNPVTVLLSGTMRAATFPASIALGAPVYISETAGDLTATQPTTTDSVIRVLGWAVTVEPNTIYFNPSPDYIEHV